MANFDLSKLMEGKNPQSVMLAETRELKGKWEQTGLLEGLNEREQSQISVLLENQAKQLLDEATNTGTSAGSEEWSGVALPLVRRIFGEIASKEFVSVQPMNLPSGLIFTLSTELHNQVTLHLTENHFSVVQVLTLVQLILLQTVYTVKVDTVIQ
jgi:hypothetical protein